MASVTAPSTPTAGSRIRTPDAPQFGYEDNYEPYTPPRKSTRIAQKTAATATPPPKVAAPKSRGHHKKSTSETSVGSPKKEFRKLSMSDEMDDGAPVKKRTPVVDRVNSGFLTATGTATAAAALGLSVPATGSGGMLITPAKTPQKAPTPKAKAKVSGFARTLFKSEEEVAQAPKAPAFKFDSLFGGESFESIEIYTDSHERIPEIDRSSENPFFSEAPRRSERQKAKKNKSPDMVYIPGEGKIPVDEAVKRDDGMLINFRGKVSFRKYTAEDTGEDLGLHGAVACVRPSVKPRVLFPEARAKETNVSDEEAETDIEEGKEHEPDTPKGPITGAPNSPPATARASRRKSTSPIKSSTKTVSPTKGAAKGSKAADKTSPFDSWTRVKGRTEVAEADSTAQKRAGSPLPSKPSKRSRV
ncbi:hypothetical protein QBC38DRAFT_110072 [Podospora fimiseda]|uniref:Uncharacterized protein n=1 Tax=Podospora fimiseda TaxID=252190 RepID=A0AAN7BTS6_9PEZI|nr:hypothetical protein QBC38DRAFT_110072 [Podospora fimiseda]